MSEIVSLIQAKESRCDKKKNVDRVYHAEIDIGSPLPIYQFKVRDKSEHSACVLVKEDSYILKSLKIGQKLKMKYWSGDNLGVTQTWHVQIKHIGKQIHGAFKGHFIVGFSILNTPSTEIDFK